MVSKEVRDYIESNTVEKLYKSCESRFAKVDYWADQFVSGDLLDEYQLSKALDELTGCFIRFHIIAGAIDSYKTNKELDFKVKAFQVEGKKPVVSQIEEEARASTRELRTYRGDFLNYSESAEKGILTCQARLKRLSVESAARGIDFKGETSRPEVVQKQIANENDNIRWDS